MVREDAVAWLQLQGSCPHGLLLNINSEMNFSKTVVVRLQDKASCEEWVKSVTSSLSAFRRKLRRQQHSLWRRAQRHVHAAYHSDSAQFVIAFMIFMNFILNIAEAELDMALEQDSTGASTTRYAFYICDLTFASFFAAELCVNVFAHWFWAFVADPW